MTNKRGIIIVVLVIVALGFGAYISGLDGLGNATQAESINYDSQVPERLHRVGISKTDLQPDIDFQTRVVTYRDWIEAGYGIQFEQSQEAFWQRSPIAPDQPVVIVTTQLSGHWQGSLGPVPPGIEQQPSREYFGILIVFEPESGVILFEQAYPDFSMVPDIDTIVP